MVSRGERAISKAEIERLQKAQKECTDGGIRKQIDDWIAEQKQKLPSSNQPPCPVCFNPCRLEECVTNPRGRAIHKGCYRTAIIEGRESL
jgi:hypothetical protein